MEKQKLIDMCLEFPQSYLDYPFDDTTPVIRHSGNKKMFALIGETDGRQSVGSDGRWSVSLKCDPLEASLLRQEYADVVPGYHLNKTHWNTVITGGDVNQKELRRQIESSYDLVKPKIRKRKTHD
ncbi:hypothetical protein FACS189499_06360 [Clostridia bacterium]|nr:hypothetical protein FACS189499_06360 [Clostridia bacterium]